MNDLIDVLAYIFGGIVISLLIVAFIGNTVECHKRGGAYVETAMGYACVEKK